MLTLTRLLCTFLGETSLHIFCLRFFFFLFFLTLLLTERHTLFRFYQFFPNVLLGFQKPIEDSTLRLVLKPPVASCGL